MSNEDTSSPSTLVMTTFLVSDRPGQMGLMMSFHKLAALELSADEAVLEERKWSPQFNYFFAKDFVCAGKLKSYLALKKERIYIW